MVKMHTRVKRNKGLTSSNSYRANPVGARKQGARTFSSKEAAESYAKEHKISGTVIPAKKGKRFKIEEQ